MIWAAAAALLFCARCDRIRDRPHTIYRTTPSSGELAVA